MIEWNNEPKDSPLWCGCIENKIKIYPAVKEISFRGWVNGDVNSMIKQAMTEDQIFRCYQSPIEYVDYRTILFFGMYRLVLHTIKIGNGWKRVS